LGFSEGFVQEQDFQNPDFQKHSFIGITKHFRNHPSLPAPLTDSWRNCPPVETCSNAGDVPVWTVRAFSNIPVHFYDSN
jgi:hypothetical protein